MRIPGLLIVLLIAGLASAQPEEKPRLLFIDYAMGYPEENAGAMDVLSRAGFEVHHRPYYPALVEEDVARYDAIALMGGGDPGMSRQEVDLAINFVSNGKTLILGVPPDMEYGGERRVRIGESDRHLFNLLMNRLNIRLYAFAPSLDNGRSFVPATVFETAPRMESGRRFSARVLTRILVGEGAEPLFVEPEQTEESVDTPPTATDAEKPKVKIVRRNIRVLPAEARPEEEIDLTLRGPQKLRVTLLYKSNRPSILTEWITEQFRGRVETAGADSLVVRASGNRWGTDYAMVHVPSDRVAVAFVKRETEEYVDAGKNLSVMMTASEDIGRLAAAAVGRADRLKKGFVAVIDRSLINVFSEAVLPGQEGDAGELENFLDGFGAYLFTLTVEPGEWTPAHPFPRARVPGIQNPDFSVNVMKIQTTLPERVRVSVHTPEASVETSPFTETGIRGVWDYVARMDGRMDSLLTLLPSLSVNTLWTVSPAASFAVADSGDSRFFSAWGDHVAGRLGASSIRWFAGVGAPEGYDGNTPPAVDARGHSVALPSLTEPRFWKNQFFDPAISIARLSTRHPSVAGVINDWETHINRPVYGYAPTDAFEDEQFVHYVRHAASNGLYRGDEFNTLKGLDRKNRYEWLLKTGRLEEYFTVLENRAERLGRLYRQTVDGIKPGLILGSFLRRPRLSWFNVGFWRGASAPGRPYALISYERPAATVMRFLRKQRVEAQPYPLLLLGLLGKNTEILQSQSARNGFFLERGAYLVMEPEGGEDLSAPPPETGRNGVIEALRSGAE